MNRPFIALLIRSSRRGRCREISHRLLVEKLRALEDNVTVIPGACKLIQGFPRRGT